MPATKMACAQFAARACQWAAQGSASRRWRQPDSAAHTFPPPAARIYLFVQPARAESGAPAPPAPPAPQRACTTWARLEVEERQPGVVHARQHVLRRRLACVHAQAQASAAVVNTQVGRPKKKRRCHLRSALCTACRRPAPRTPWLASPAQAAHPARPRRSPGVRTHRRSAVMQAAAPMRLHAARKEAPPASARQRGAPQRAQHQQRQPPLPPWRPRSRKAARRVVDRHAHIYLFCPSGCPASRAVLGLHLVSSKAARCCDSMGLGASVGAGSSKHRAHSQQLQSSARHKT
jgi:hypothetical protein